jgi:hypothetical protein
MDPTRNPFSPGAGARPPELAGREAIVASATIALQRIARGRQEKSQMLLGLRGVGKTVLLNRIGQIAEDMGAIVVTLEAPEGQRLAAFLAPALKAVLLKLSRVEQARDLAQRALGALRGFASAFTVSIGEIDVAIAPETVADSGNLEVDLPELMACVGKAAQAAGKTVVILLDEVQYLSEEDLRGLIVAMHRIAQRGWPVILFGAGLPQVAALAGEAKSYAERLFDYPAVGPLLTDAAREAIDNEALNRILAITEGYPYFLQEWGKHSWNTAKQSPIQASDVEQASTLATEALDRSFFRVRFDRLTPREQDYLRAMASLGAGPHRSGDIADVLGITVQTAGPLRSGLIKKGMIWSPAHGQTAFTVPMFDAFMVRAMPEWGQQQLG